MLNLVFTNKMLVVSALLRHMVESFLFGCPTRKQELGRLISLHLNMKLFSFLQEEMLYIPRDSV